MLKYFDDMSDPKASWRAVQLWQILASCAHNQQIITYGQLAEILGFDGAGVFSHPLGRIMAYCHINDLPALTTLVVNQETGAPGRGLETIDDYRAADKDRMIVFNYKWYKLVPPTAEEFDQAYKIYNES